MKYELSKSSKKGREGGRKSGSPFTTEYPSDGDTAATMAGMPERQKRRGDNQAGTTSGTTGNNHY
jgi:hypothetical protein